MSKQLLASKIIVVEDEPQVRTIQGVQDSIAGFLGITEKGPVGEAKLLTGMSDYDAYFGGYVANGDVRQAVEGFFQNGGGSCYVARTVHYTDVTDKTTKTSAKGSVSFLSAGAAASPGAVLGSVVGPFNLDPGDTIQITTDVGGPSTATFNATAASRDSTDAGDPWPKALSNGQTLTVSIDGGPVQTVAFLTAEFVSIGAATAAEVAAVLAAKLVGVAISVVGGQVRITSDKLGTDSGVNVTGGTANTALGFTTGNQAGTGNVADINQVTVAEVKSVVEAAVAGVTVSNVGGAVKIARNTNGASSTVQVVAGSSADDEMGLDNATHTGSDGSAVATLRFDGKYDGTYAHAFRAKVEAATSGEADRFNVLILKNNVIVESFGNVSMDDDDERHVEKIVNDPTTGSKYLEAVDLAAGTGAALTDRPANGTSANLSGGSDGLAGLADTDFTGAEGANNGKTGLRVFDLVNDMAILAVPGRATAAVHNAMITYAEVTRDMSMFAILDPPAGLSATAIVTYFETTAAVLGLSEFGAAYWPRIKVLNPNKTVFGNSEHIVVAPSGHIAGVYARVAAAKPGGVYTPPAGEENGKLLGCLGFETDEVLEEPKRDIVYPKRINPLTQLSGPRHIDGTKTLKGGGNFPSVAERRGATFIEQSIKNGIQFARHRNNDEELRSEVSRTVEAFLLIQMRNGAFRTKNPDTAFSVDFGDALNPPSVQFAGQLIGRIGLATQKPADFIVLRFSQDTRALQEELAA